ncbi:MAG: hypothetical protein R3C53_00790 [Pirellulaceae bacterium]
MLAWEAEAHKPQWNSYLDPSHFSAAAGLVGIVALCAIGIAWRPTEAKLALVRMMAPWSSNAWPSRDQLRFQNLPSVVGIGSELQLEVVDDNPPLPADVMIEFRDTDPTRSINHLVTKQVDQLAIGNLPVLKRSVDVRAVGGDDQSMPWQRIEVIAPPNFERHNFEIELPAYTQQPTRELVGNRIQVLSGSHVSFHALLSETIKSIELRIVSQAPASRNSTGTDFDELPPSVASPIGATADGTHLNKSNEPPQWIVRIEDDGRSLKMNSSGNQPCTHSIAWRFAITTAAGLEIELPDLWSIEVVADVPPNVTLLSTSTPRITANAEIQLQGHAADDLGLIDVWACVQPELPTQSEPTSYRLWSSDTAQSPLNYSVDHRWDLAQILADKQLAITPGQTLSLWLEAHDTLGQLGRSQPGRIEIVDDESFLADSFQHQREVLARLRELIAQQRRSSERAQQATDRISDSEQLTRGEADAWLSLVELQTSIIADLTGQRGSLSDDVEQIRRSLELNHLGETAAAEQMRLLEQSIHATVASELQTALNDLHKMDSSVRTQVEAEQSAERSLLELANQANNSQSAALHALQDLADRFDRSGGLQQLQRDFTQLAKEQATIHEDSSALQLESLGGRAPDEVTASRRKLSSEQLALAQRLDQLLARTRELSGGEEHNQDAGLASQLTQAAESLTAGQVSRLMRQATEQLDSQQFATATETQQQILDELTTALRSLRTQGASTASRNLTARAEQVSQLADEVAGLADRQSQLAEDMQNLGTTPDAVANEQARLSEATQRQVEETAAIGDRRSSKSIERSRESQQAAEQALQDQQLSSAANAAQTAAEQLQSAAEQLRARADELQQQARLQQIFRLRSELEQLTDAQTPLVERLRKLADQPASEQRETDSRQLALDQAEVRQALADVKRSAEALPTFAWALDQADVDMARAVAAAERFRIAPEALDAASDALNKLTLAAEAIQANPSISPDTPPETNEPNSKQNASAKNLPPLASLRLLRGLQQAINDQTLAVEQEPDGPRRQQRLTELSQQQESLGKQLGEILGVERSKNQPFR